MASLTCHGDGGAKQVRLERIVRRAAPPWQQPCPSIVQFLGLWLLSQSYEVVHMAQGAVFEVASHQAIHPRLRLLNVDFHSEQEILRSKERTEPHRTSDRSFGFPWRCTDRCGLGLRCPRKIQKRRARVEVDHLELREPISARLTPELSRAAKRRRLE